MPIPPVVVNAARIGWRWQWQQLMNGLAPADKQGHYLRPVSQCQRAYIPKREDLINRKQDLLPRLIIGRSCPWAHRTWIVYELRKLKESLTLVHAQVDEKAGLWKLNPPLLGCNSLLKLYEICDIPTKQRATVPALIDPLDSHRKKPALLGNESSQLVEVLNKWPTSYETSNLEPNKMQEEITSWQKLLQPSVNNGVYKCGFARNQYAYDKACDELFESLAIVNKSLNEKGPWLCGDQVTLADIRLFPTLIRWESIYVPLFSCSKKPLWAFSKIWEWRQRFLSLPEVSKTCDAEAWRKDYFGALFPLRPNNIVPAGPDLITMVNAKINL